MNYHKYLVSLINESIIDSEEFKNWFGDSKVVDKKGNPLIVYHGTTTKFNKFSVGDIGFHFGVKKLQARHRSGFGKNSIIMECYLSLQNPLYVDRDLGSWEPDYVLEYLFKNNIISEDEYKSGMKKYDLGYYYPRAKYTRDLIKEKGYDGIKYLNTKEGSGNDVSYIALYPNQIKSVNNNGKWNKNSNNIYEHIIYLKSRLIID